MLYGLSGALEIDIADTPSSLVEGGGTFIPAGRPATISASGAGPADFLIFELSPRPNQTAPLLDPDAVEELYRTPEPLPGLKPGPYEFSLTRVSLPPGMPANPPHYRSGAALYYILSGSGLFTVAGNTEPRTAGMPHFEPAGMVHQWANPADTPLVLIQANISQEGIPAVIAPGAK
jgi:quercetin dioxygenase-like cupin family protein